MMFWYGNGWGWWQGALAMVGMVAFWGLLAWAVYALVRGGGHSHVERGGAPDARAVLDERLARGEIDPDQYRAMRELIRTGGAGPASPGAPR